MAIVILVSLIAVTVTFLVWDLVTRTAHRRRRDLVTFALLALLAVLALTGAIPWGGRYYLLAGVLLIHAAIAALRLLRARFADPAKAKAPKPVRPVRPVRRTVRAVCAVAGWTLATAPALLVPAHADLPEPTGPLAVATTVATYVDPERPDPYAASDPRYVNVEFWYPAEGDGTDGPYPLLVFSHGFIGVRHTNDTMFAELASHGYVVASIDHPHQAYATEGLDGGTARFSFRYIGQYLWGGAGTAADFYPVFREWTKIRVADFDLALDSILDRAAAGDPAPYSLVDVTRIAAGGHSMGGAAALAVARERDDIDAVIALEAPVFGDITGATGEAGTASEGWTWLDEPWTVPTLNVYSDAEWPVVSNPAKATDTTSLYYRNAQWIGDQTPGVVSVHLVGVSHLALTDMAIRSPRLVRLLDATLSRVPDSAEDLSARILVLNQLALEFLDSTLKGTGDFAPAAEQ